MVLTPFSENLASVQVICPDHLSEGVKLFYDSIEGERKTVDFDMKSNGAIVIYVRYFIDADDSNTGRLRKFKIQPYSTCALGKFYTN